METISAFGFTGFLGKGLSLRELQCLLGIAAGRTSKELARDLNMQPATVDKRVLAATTKLRVTKRAALVGEAFRRGILAHAVFVLAALTCLHSVTSEDPAMRTRRGGERRVELRVAARRIESGYAA